MNRKVLTILAAGALALAASGCTKQTSDTRPMSRQAPAATAVKGLVVVDRVYVSETVEVFVLTDVQHCEYLMTIVKRKGSHGMGTDLEPRMTKVDGKDVQVCRRVVAPAPKSAI